jgi:Xaa-Pro aminopeptidase
VTEPKLPVLLVASGHGDAEWRYATGIDIEQGVFLDLGTDQVLVSPELEYERARVQGKVRTVLDRRESGWKESRDAVAAWAGVARHLLAERGVGAVRVSPKLPVERRRHKTREEASFIHAAQRAAEAACAEVIAYLAVAENKDGLLWLDRRPLTSERLMARAEAALAEIGYTGADMIIAGSPECALPHFRGEGQLRADAPIIIDIFPQGKTSGYHGDLTRTVVVGEVSDEVRRMWEASCAAMDAAITMLKAGVNGRDVHHAACRVLVEHGFGTYTAGFEGRLDGPRMSHSLGHGVGLEVHEAPNLRDLDYPLEAGDVVTVEPGLYRTGLGGVRVEDTGIVTGDGFTNFTSLPRSLDPKAYL